MIKTDPIYTEETECQDCYKCIRRCPVKAIRVKDGHAVITGERCILCGICVQVCPVGAKKIRNDNYQVEEYIKQNDFVIASVAPAIAALEKSGAIPSISEMLGKIGFDAFSLTSRGADGISDHLDSLFQNNNAVWASSACPSVVRYLKLYPPQADVALTPLPSPMQLHAHMLKKQSKTSRVVFIGPCAAKKWESDSNPELVDKVLTIDELIDLHLRMRQKSFPFQKNCVFIDKDLQKTAPSVIHDGNIYPLPGGMIQCVENRSKQSHVKGLAMSGIHHIQESLNTAKNLHNPADSTQFLELLACSGGCLEGHCKITKRNSVNSRFMIEEYKKADALSINKLTVEGERKQSKIELPRIKYNLNEFRTKQLSESDISSFLQKIGKTRPEDEKDCGACGYDSCRQFSEACLQEHAEQNMCVSNLRTVAEKKANALLHTIPAGVVIVDHDLRILECNRSFLRYFAPAIEAVFDEHVASRLVSVKLDTLVQASKWFRAALLSNSKLENQHVKHENQVYNLTVFPIENNNVMGGIFQNITEPFVQRENIIEKARTVLEKNVQTVQQIAFLLGENASESEMMLNSIIESFSQENGND